MSGRKVSGPVVLMMFLTAGLFVQPEDCPAVWEGPYVSERTYPWDRPENEKQLPDPNKAAGPADKREIIKDEADKSLYFDTHGNVVSHTGADAVELRHLPDGTYRGTYPDHGAQRMVLDLVIRDGQIVDIETAVSRDDVYIRKVGGMIDRIIEKQSLRVDTVTGATVTSKAVLGAIHDAISKALKKRRQQDGG